MKLRPYQIAAIDAVRQEWERGQRNVVLVSPTGSGKSAMAATLVGQAGVPAISIAHRQELILQKSEALARAGVHHHIIAPKSVVRFCTERHVQLFGHAFTHGTRVHLASVQTLLRRYETHRAALGQVRLWDIDECHHVTRDNVWGKAVALFPNAMGLGVTATPVRCDGRGLEEVFDTLVDGPDMRQLINEGFLSDYRIFCPPVGIDVDGVRIGSGGEYIQSDLDEAVERSHIVGDVVSHYLRLAPGKRGLTFAVNLANARQLTDAYNAAGVAAAYVDGGTPDRERMDALDKLARGELMQIVNVGLFGEGMDCPALEVVTMARPTQSYGLYSQMFGRALRTAEGKTHAIIIDHVGNVVRHGLPDRPRQWSLVATRRTRQNPDQMPMTVCENCIQPRERFIKVCPYCGHQNVPAERGMPEHVDGDLHELDPAVLMRMRNEVIDLDRDPAIPHGATAAIIGKRKKDHAELVAHQKALRQAMMEWAGPFKYLRNMPDAEIQRLFYLRFGTDVLTAQALRARDAEKLTQRIREMMGE